MINFVCFTIFLIGFTAGLEALGRFVLRIVHADSVADEWILAWAAGAGLLTCVLLLLLFSGFYTPSAMWAVLGVLVAFALARIGYGILHAPQKQESLLESRFTPALLRICISVMLLLLLLTVLTPESRHDPYDYHLTVPTLYLLEGGATEIAWHTFSYMPKNGEVLFGFALGVGNDSLAKLIHYLFGIACLGVIYSFLRRAYNHEGGLFGVFWFVTLPAFGFVAASAYIDLIRAFWELLALYLLYRAWENQGRAQTGWWLTASAACAGFSMGSKYVAWGVFFPPYALLLLIALFRLVNQKRPIWILACMAAGLVPILPWLSLNYVWTGNPFYPLLPSLFGMHSPAAADAYQFFRDHAPPAEVWQFPGFFDSLGSRFYSLLIEGNALILLGLLALALMPWWRKVPHEPRLPRPIVGALVFYLLAGSLLFFTLTHNEDGRFFLSVLALLGMPVTLFLERVQTVMDESTVLRQYFLPALILIVFINALTYRYNQLLDHDETIIPHITEAQRHDYLERNVADYPLTRWANENLPAGAFVLGMGYPLERRHIPRVKHGYVPMLHGLQNPDAGTLAQTLQQHGVTHIIEPFPDLAPRVDFSVLKPRYLELVHQYRGKMLYALRDSSTG